MRTSRRLTHLVTGLTIASLGAGALSLAGGASAAPPAPTVLTFDDLGQSTGGTHMVDGYGTFSWNTSDWYSMSVPFAPTNTFISLSGNAASIRHTGGSDFTFQGIDAWSRRGLDATGAFYFVLSRDGVKVYDGRDDRDGKLRFTGTSTTFTANYAGPVDTVAIVFGGNGTDWDHFALDNLRFTDVDQATTVTTVVPAPAPVPAPTPAPGTTTATYRLSTKTVGKGSIAVSRTGTTFVAGQVITLTATPAAGQVWKGWTGAVVSMSPTITVTMNSNITVTANFK